jgi:hypothetical protein
LLGSPWGFSIRGGPTESLWFLSVLSFSSLPVCVYRFGGDLYMLPDVDGPYLVSQSIRFLSSPSRIAIVSRSYRNECYGALTESMCSVVFRFFGY